MYFQVFKMNYSRLSTVKIGQQIIESNSQVYLIKMLILISSKNDNNNNNNDNVMIMIIIVVSNDKSK